MIWIIILLGVYFAAGAFFACKFQMPIAVLIWPLNLWAWWMSER